MRQPRRWVSLTLVVMGAALVASLCGCLGPTIERYVVYQAACAHRFRELVRTGQTTRAEEQAYITANEHAWQALGEAMGIRITAREKTPRTAREASNHASKTDSKSTGTKRQPAR